MAGSTAAERSQGALVQFELSALAILGARFVQGFIFWGGASRRMIYDYTEIAGVDHAIKLDFEAAGFVANKMTHALPGALWIQGPLEWTLTHPDLILASVWLWTLAELAVGVGLVLGLLTRMFAIVSIGLNISLMLIFGWMGSTCLDEWTMAVSGVAISAAIVVAGGGKFSLDGVLLTRSTWAASRSWIPWLTSGSLSADATRRLGIILATICIGFTVGTYHVLFGAVVSPLDPRTSYHRHHVTLSDATVSADGATSFSAYVDAGPDTGAAYIISAELHDAAGAMKAHWDGQSLARLAKGDIENAYPYVWASRFTTERIGFGGVTGARATINFPPPSSAVSLQPGSYTVVLESITGTKWKVSADFSR